MDCAKIIQEELEVKQSHIRTKTRTKMIEIVEL